jgi:hypothetical protein
MTDLNVNYNTYNFNFKVTNKEVANKENTGYIRYSGILQSSNKDVILTTYTLYITKNNTTYTVDAYFSNEYIIFNRKYESEMSPFDYKFLPEITILSTNNMKKNIILKIDTQTDADNFTLSMDLIKPLLYLANPIGFNPSYQSALDDFIRILSSIGYQVIEPFAVNNKVDFSDPNWIWKVNNDDILDAQVCDVIFSIYNGIAPDEGVVVESSYGFKTNAVVFYFRDDIRSLTKYGVPMNIMLFCSYNPNTWFEYYYTNINDLLNPQRLLVSDFYTYLFNKNKNKLSLKGFPYNNYDSYNN